ncbi:hypothetical protein KO495_13840 [Colwellia sp. D2M02]|uniref:hypothetical protein n=1 Tax=Colwellia sp. D2M02 TaxID=2841562 RepID=UPI001C095B88|nr:hypothetical protein [Colwellia sp. D2M02]MBU2894392.1 hypothetical protein [Colwellia sp. D2M02]
MSIETPDKVETKPAHRELVFENIGADTENVSLMIFDSAPKGVKPFAKATYYRIPLYQAQSRERSSTDADVELVHICPKRYAQAGSKIVDNEHWLRDGYLYIYVDGYIWRELKVSYDPKAGTSTFSDVNLKIQKGEQLWKKTLKVEDDPDRKHRQGEREATGESLKTILVPYKLQGSVCKVEVAYSEVQWAWRQVQAFGGMSPTDPRLNGHEAVKVREAPEDEAAQRRAERMVELDNLGQYQQAYSNQEHPQHLALPFTDPSGVYTPVIDDEIGRAREAAKEVMLARKALDLLQVSSAIGDDMPDGKEIPKATEEQAGKYAIAQVIQNQFFAFPQNVQNKIKTMGEGNVNEAEVDLASDYKKWAEESLHVNSLRSYLKTAEAFEIVNFITEMKTEAFEIITGESERGSFYHAIADYGYFKCDDSRRCGLYKAVSDVVGPLKDKTGDLIKSFIITEADQRKLAEIERQDMGQETILKVLGTHIEDLESDENMLKLIRLLFPKQTGENLEDYESYADPNKPFDITFDVDDFKRLNENDDYLTEPSLQLVRRSLQVVWGFLNITLEVPQAMFVMNKHQQPFKTAYASHIKQEESLKNTSKALKNKINQLEGEIANKQKVIKTLEVNRLKIHAEISTQGMNPASIDAQLIAIIEERKAELDALKQEAYKAKNANIRTKRHIANLISAGQDLLALDGTVKISNVAVRHNPYIRFTHLSHMVTNGLITEIDIDVNQYLKGNLPNSKIPLNFSNRAVRAKQKLDDFNRVSSGFDSAMTDGGNAPKVKLNIKNHSIQTRLDHLVHLDGSLDTLEDMIDEQILAAERSKQVLQRKMLVIDGTLLSNAEISAKTKEQDLEKKKGKKTKADFDLIAYEAQTKTLSFYKKWNLNPALFNKTFNAMLPFVATMEVLNFYRTVENDGVAKINKISAALDLADLMVSIGRNIAERKVGLPTSTQVRNIIESGIPPNSARTRILGQNLSKLILKVGLIILGDTLTFVAGAVSMFCAYLDMAKALDAGNTGLAVGHGIMIFGFGAMTAGSGLALMGYVKLIAVIATGPFFIVGLIALLVGVAVVYFFTESAIESWLQACPWGKHKYIDDTANTSSIRASQWQTRPDLCLIDLYNVLYSPQVNIDNNLIAKRVDITLNAPKVGKVNGLDFTLSWRKLSQFLGSAESKYHEISLKQLELTDGSWQLLLNRSGWKYSVSYNQLIKALGLNEHDNIELKASVTVFPEGKGAKVLPAFDTAFSLPLQYSKIGEDTSWFWQNDNRVTAHRVYTALSTRSVRLNNQTLETVYY